MRGSDGTLFRGSRVVEARRNHAGSYTVVFDAPIVGDQGDRPRCALIATPTHLDDDIHTSISPMTYTGSPTTVHVEMYRDGLAGEDPRILVDQSFALAAIC